MMMDAVLAKIINGEISLEDVEKNFKSNGKEDVCREKENLKKHNLTDLAPFLLNYLREQTSHFFMQRQNAALTPRKAQVSQSKGSNLVGKQLPQGPKNYSKGSLFPSQKTPSPSPVTPLSQRQRDRSEKGRHSSPSSSPRPGKKSPKFIGSDIDRSLPLVGSQHIDINDPDDFPPMGTNRKKATPSRRITPTPVKSDGRKGKLSPAFSSTGPSFSQLSMESHSSPASLQEERNILKLMKTKRKSKGESPWENRNSPSAQTGVRSPPLHVLGDYIITPPKQTTTSKNHVITPPNAWQPNINTGGRVLSTPSPVKDFIGNASLQQSLVADDLSSQRDEKKTCKEEIQAVQVDQLKVNSQEKLDVLAKMYSNCVTGNLVPNVTAELYFVVQLLTVRGISSDCKENEEPSSENYNEKNNPNILNSIHNCTYFAVTVLQDLESLILLLDKDTLRLFADNPRIAAFSPRLKETFLQQYKSLLPVKVSELKGIKSPLGGVPFNVEKDNKQNFPTDRAFHNFRKQRDVFYELIREWEDCNAATGWNMEDHMGDRIRALVNQKPEMANYSHFARLFKSQLLQMCDEERNGSSFRSQSMLSNLQKSNPEKFQRLQERFVTPSSSSGPCPSPSFTNVQEFFKGFIMSAASHSFNQHLIDLLIVTITETNDKEFPLSDVQEDSEKDRSIQNQELKQEFFTCTTEIRILAKFLGFLLFQPYYGAEITSQTSMAETLKLRNKIPVQFDVLNYLKRAWCQGRLVLTVPWAVEYLSMMDPVAPLLGYFSDVFHWLCRTYRELDVYPKAELNHSKLLLISCLGWLFEIPVIPASFFFKSLSEHNISVDYQCGIKHSDQKMNLDCSGLVDQDILYSCCPYLGEIRSLLVEAAAGLYGRTGPVKKITPVSADEPSRISSSQKQLQLQLEENFFRIQPDFVKRLSDFTVERLCSNIISHIKGSIIPSVLDKGSQRIQEFLEVEFSNNVKIDQAKGKCRPDVLKIIHAVTDDGVKIALETMEKSKTKICNVFENLCPEDMNLKVISTAANITTRLVKDKITDWINTSFPNIVDEELFAQFNKIANSILCSKSKEQNSAIESLSKEGQSDEKDTPTAKSSCCGKLAAQSDNPIMIIKALQAALSEQSKLLAQQSSDENTSQVVEAVCSVESLLSDKSQIYTKDMTLIGQVTVELAFILVCRTSCGVELLNSNCLGKDRGILDKLTKLWRRLKAQQVPAPLSGLLSAPHVRLIMAMKGSQVIWKSLEALIIVLLREQVICVHEIEQCYMSALENARDEEGAVEIGKACCSLVQAYHDTTKTLDAGNAALKTDQLTDFSLLLAILNQRFTDNVVLTAVISNSIKEVARVIEIPVDHEVDGPVAASS
ncbi:codanin-1-like [Montipora foliosa]|uniref:codanin-1-like n=1 Tax=Montipora foliosa TaxID=591990 RepID=UPI0035F1A14D